MILGSDKTWLTIRAPDNWHAHFRQGQLMEFLVPVFLDAGWCRRIIAEPNTHPHPILTGKAAVQYRDGLLRQSKDHVRGGNFEPIMVIQITEQTTAETVKSAHDLGVRVCKVYPFFVTTNSENGVKDYRNILGALRMAAGLGMVVQFHGEDPDHEVEGLDKAAKFLLILDMIRSNVPDLIVSLEHISVKEDVDWVIDQGSKVGASITIQHLLMTLDDVTGYSLRSGGKGSPTLICKPTLQRRRDRDAIAEVVLQGDKRFWYGGDDAAHPKSKKYDHECACGVWNTIVAMPHLIGFFEEYDKLDRLEPFTSEHGATFYGFPISGETITFVKQKWEVPRAVLVENINDYLVPMSAGETLEWRILSEED